MRNEEVQIFTYLQPPGTVHDGNSATISQRAGPPFPWMIKIAEQSQAMRSGFPFEESDGKPSDSMVILHNGVVSLEGFEHQGSFRSLPRIVIWRRRPTGRTTSMDEVLALGKLTAFGQDWLLQQRIGIRLRHSKMTTTLDNIRRRRATARRAMVWGRWSLHSTLWR